MAVQKYLLQANLVDVPINNGEDGGVHCPEDIIDHSIEFLKYLPNVYLSWDVECSHGSEFPWDIEETVLLCQVLQLRGADVGQCLSITKSLL